MIENTSTDSCMLRDYRECNSATNGVETATPHATAMQQTSLKALAKKVLERNTPCNSNATKAKKSATFNATSKGQQCYTLQQVADKIQNMNKDLKIRYNALLVREKKAETYIDNNAIPIYKREAWLPEFNKIIKEMGYLLKEIRLYTPHEVLSGFKV
jgi:hypothetical protein